MFSRHDPFIQAAAKGFVLGVLAGLTGFLLFALAAAVFSGAY